MLKENGSSLRIENYGSADIDIFELPNYQIYLIEIIGEKKVQEVLNLRFLRFKVAFSKIQ